MIFHVFEPGVCPAKWSNPGAVRQIWYDFTHVTISKKVKFTAADRKILASTEKKWEGLGSIGQRTQNFSQIVCGITQGSMPAEPMWEA